MCWPQVFLSQLVSAGDAGSLPPLLRVPLMDKAEEQLVLKGFNENQTRPYDSTTFVHSMFADAVKRHPEAPCVIFEGCVYSYFEARPACGTVDAEHNLYSMEVQQSITFAGNVLILPGMDMMSPACAV